MLDHSGEVVTLSKGRAPSNSIFPHLPNSSPLARARMPVTHNVSFRGFETKKIPFLGHFVIFSRSPDLARDLRPLTCVIVSAFLTFSYSMHHNESTVVEMVPGSHFVCLLGEESRWVLFCLNGSSTTICSVDCETCQQQQGRRTIRLQELFV